jgi:hypothetical protein
MAANMTSSSTELELVCPLTPESSRAEFLRCLKLKIWHYPETRTHATNENVSLIAFDLFVCLGVLLVTLISIAMKSASKNSTMVSDMAAKLAELQTRATPRTSGPLKEVAHVRREAVFLWLSVFTAITFVTFKILSGAVGANAGDIFLILMVAFFAKMLRQESEWSDTGRTIMGLLPTGLAIVGSYFGYIGYTKNTHYSEADTINRWYVTTVVFGLLAIFMKMVHTLFEDRMSPKQSNGIKAISKISGEYMYAVRLLDVIVLTVVFGFFFAFEGIVVAQANTSLYAIGFWPLLVLPVYCFIMQFVAIFVEKNISVMPLLFNMLLAVLVFAIIIISQMQVCSIMGVKDDDNLHHIPRGCMARWGLHAYDGALRMHTGSIWLLGIFTSLLITLLYAGATFTAFQLSLQVRTAAKTTV